LESDDGEESIGKQDNLVTELNELNGFFRSGILSTSVYDADYLTRT